MLKPSRVHRFLCCAALLAPFLARGVRAQGITITEFMASNSSGLADEDGEHSDWLELHNAGAGLVNLNGWYLTDDPTALTKWRLPSTPISAGGYLVVIASGKDRAIAGQQLHTNFKLTAEGGYLGLVKPDGATIADEYPALYPPQREDISYGVSDAPDTTAYVPIGAAARFLVPSNGALGLGWTDPAFADGAWTSVATAVGFDTAAGGGGPPVNVARQGVATQSSTLGGFVASLGNDGVVSNFTHTQAGVGTPARWELTLDGTHSIGAIVLRNRADCCGSRLRDVTVSILDAARTTTLFTSQLLNPENTLGGGGTGGPGTITVDVVALAGGPISGAVVRVVRTPDPDLSGTGGQGNGDEADVLSLGEVEVLEAQGPLRPLIATDVETAMRGVSRTAYLRVPFTLEEAPDLSHLELRMRHDDGFIAYLNGQEIARRNAPAVASFSSAAAADRADSLAGTVDAIDVTAFAGSLRVGLNVLAIHGLDAAVDDAGFLLQPELVGASETGVTRRYFRTPTPGAINSTNTIAGFVADTKLEPDRGFYDAPIQVTISSATAGATVRYTTDGSPPTPTTGTVYSGPIQIAKTTVLRAIALRPGLEPTNVDTHSYLFLADIIRQSYQATLDAGFPATWGGTGPDYGMDPDVIGQTGPDKFGGKYAATIRDDLKAVPTLSIVLKTDDLFGSNGIYTNSTARGDAWERPASAELILPDGTKGFQVNCGLRVQGGAFRDHGLTKKHSLRLAFRSVYGASKLHYPLFGPDATDEIDTVTLRANSNDGYQWSAAGGRALYVRDSFGRQSVLDMGEVAEHETFVHLYLNGVYWGLYNPVERPDDAFSATYYGGRKADWDAISNSEVQGGNITAWNTLFALARQGLSSAAAYQKLQGNRPDGSDDPALPDYLDVDQYIDYMITNLYVGNTDWPGKNYWAGRVRDANLALWPASTGFKFYMWDSEWSMGIQSDLGTNVTGISSGVAEPYAALRSNPEFRVRFGDHLHRHFFNGGVFYVDPVNSAWDPAHPERNRPAARFAKLCDAVDRAIVAESARWGDQHNGTPFTRDEDWELERDNLLASYFPGRSRVVLDQFRAQGLYPAVEAPVLSHGGGWVPKDFALQIRVASGTAYYTTDGTDPRLTGGAISPTATAAGAEQGVTLVLVASQAAARVLVPTDGALGLGWTARNFDDASWTAGTTGVGYERDTGYETLIGTDVEAQTFNLNASVYLRVPFNVADPSLLELVTLRMKYDDGYVAYVNGVQVAAKNAPASPVWNSQSTASRADAQAVIFETVDLDLPPGLIQTGNNVLAIHGLNVTSNSGDLLILPELVSSPGPAESTITIERSTIVRTRSLAGGVWSALNEATFAQSPLRITEVMYHPESPGQGSLRTADDFEFLEIKNTGGEAESLVGFRIEGGVSFDFTGSNVTTIAPGEFVLVVRDIDAFSERYTLAGVRIAGEYSGKLANSSDRVALVGPLGEIIHDFTYAETWYPATDGEGPSLVTSDESQAIDLWGVPQGWRPSREAGGSPGFDDDDAPPPPGGRQLPADLNQDSNVDLSDAIATLGHLFLGSPAQLPCGDGSSIDPANLALADSNSDQKIDLTDAIYLLNYLFLGGTAPAGGEACVRIVGCPDACSP